MRRIISLSATFFLVWLVFYPRQAHAGACGMGNDCPTVNTFALASTPVPLGATVSLNCAASDPNGVVTRIDITVDGGTFSNGGSSISVTPTAAQSVQVTVAWTAPAVPGNYLATCTAWDNGGWMPNPAQGPAQNLALSVQAAGAQPLITSLIASTNQSLPGQVLDLRAVINNPTSNNLTWQWTADAGSIAGDTDATPATIQWTAPQQIGSSNLTLTITNAIGQQASATLNIETVLARPESQSFSLSFGLFYPERIAVDTAGFVYVTDPRANNIQVFTPKGEPLRSIDVDGTPSGIAVDDTGTLYVGNRSNGSVAAIQPDGSTSLLGKGAGEFVRPVDLAIARYEQIIYVADAGAGEIRSYRPDGSLQQTLDIPDALISSVAFDSVTRLLYAGDAQNGRVLVFRGNKQVQVIGSFGSDNGELSRVAGVDVDAQGNVYVTDAFQARVSVFDSTGQFVSNIGNFGSGLGDLRIPVDVALSGDGRIIVSSTNNERLEVYQHNAVPQQSCSGDRDCDGLPDIWETAMGTNPDDPADAYQDADHDGLLTIEEYQADTDPFDADSDHDGIPDGVELAAGLDPANASDNLPFVSAGLSLALPPSRIVLEGNLNDPNGDALSFAWSQVAGPTHVLISDKSAIKPWTVLRKAGKYSFQLLADDGVVSAASIVEIEIPNVKPQANAGSDQIATVGHRVDLNGSFSHDANGDALVYSWSMVAGPTISEASANNVPATPPPANATSGKTSFVPLQAGVYTFSLSAYDPAGLSSEDTVDIVADATNSHVPQAIARSLGGAAVSQKVILDGSASLDADGDTLAWHWKQVQGPTVHLTGSRESQASFVPTAPGNYRFELTVQDADYTSTPAVVAVAVGAANNHRPIAEAGADRRSYVLQKVTLSCALSSDPDGDDIHCAWRQLEGVQVALDESAGSSSFVPLQSGTYIFELTVEEESGASDLDTVTIVVDDPAKNHVPTAAVALPGTAVPGTTVVLDASASSDPDPDARLHFQWVQTAGSRVLLTNPSGSSASFVPAEPGNYSFELRVNDGIDLSPPITIDIPVGSKANGAPLADAGTDLLITPQTPAAISALNSRDPEGSPLTYNWRRTGGPANVTLQGIDTSVLQIKPEQTGYTLQFELIVSDGKLESAPDTVNVNVVDLPIGLYPVGAEGGTVSVENSESAYQGMKLDIPAGALAGDLQLALGEVALAYTGTNDSAFGSALFVGPANQKFGKPVDIRVPLDLTQPQTSGIEAKDIKLMQYDQANDNWIEADNYQVDPATGILSFSTMTAGIFQIVVPVQRSTEATVESSGFGCSASSGSADFSLVLLMIAALGSMLYRRKKMLKATAMYVMAATFAFGIFMAPTTASATDAPHDLTRLTNGCKDCHMIHNAPAATLTNVIGNANLCMSCHALQGMNWVSSDQAIPGVSGSSHRWDATVTNATFETSMPTNNEMKIRLDAGKLICSTCHQQHLQVNAPADARSPGTPGSAGRHFQRINNESAQMCLDCHRVRDIQSVKDGSWTGANLSHPVQVPLKGSCGLGSQGADCTTCMSGFSGPGCTAIACVVNGTACGYGLCSLSGSGCVTSTCGVGKSHDDVNPAICNTNGTCPSASCVNAETCSLSPVDSDIVCACPVGYDAATCSTCRTGFSGPSCTTTACATAGDTCGFGTCIFSAGDCTISECPVNQHNNDSTGVCIADTACAGGSCSGVLAACKLNPTSNEAYCDCPIGYNGPSCASCSTGFSGGSCAATTCLSAGQACGYGTCANTPGAGNEQQTCADTPDGTNFGVGLPCESATCISEEAGAALGQAIGGDCISQASTLDGTLITSQSYVFNTSNPDNTNFYIWMRNSMDSSFEPTEQHDCTLTGVFDGTPAGATLNFSYTEAGVNAGWYGAACQAELAGAGWAGFYCWMALNTSGVARATPIAVPLNNGAHTLTCTITVNNGNGGSEDGGYDGFLFTTNAAFVPSAGDGPAACTDLDPTFSGGTCATENWGPNVQPPPGPLACGSCSIGYTGANCDTCDVGFTAKNGVCVNTDPCATVTCQNGGTCYVDSNNTAVCDCTGQYFGQTPGAYCTSCTATPGLKCQACAVGYTGPGCDTCDVGYTNVDGACVADPCSGITCQNGGTCFVNSTGAAECDCAGQFYGNLCQNCDNPATAVCGCQTGYTGANCDQCDTAAGYFAFNGRCVLTDPCQAGNCTRMSFYTPPKDANGNPQLEVIASTATGGNTTLLQDTAQNWPDLTGKFVRFTSGANNTLTRVISSSTPTQINFAAVPVAVVAGDSYEIDSDGNLTNNFLLSSGSKGSYTSGNIECTSCHGPHYADSNPNTYDDQPRPGDGNLLRRGNDNTACEGCHAEKMHNSAQVGTKYGTWGATWTCKTCHTPHKTKNIYLVNEIIQTPNNGPQPVDFRSMEVGVGPNALADSTNPGFGPCEVCHTQTQNTDTSPRYRNSAPYGDQAKHYTQRCEGCHDHKDGFKAGESDGGVECWGCHYDIWTRMNGQITTTQAGPAIVTKHSIGTVREYNDSPDPAFPNITWASNLGAEPVTDRSCTNMCHTDHIHNIVTDHSKTVHSDATDASTRIKANEVSTDFDPASNAGLCISCHDQQVDAQHPPIDGVAYNASAHDYTTASGNTWEYQHHDATKFQRNCTKCHADRDDAMPNELSDQNNPTASVHYSRDPSLLAGDTNPAGTVNEFICYNCHGDGASGTVDRSGKIIKTQIDKLAGGGSGHPAHSDAVHNSVAEKNNAAFGNNLGGAARHASCMDCHETHIAQAGTHTSPGNKAGPPLEGAWGAEMTTYPTRWVAPAAGNFTKKTIVAGTDLEATLCFKCHSSYYGTLPNTQTANPTVYQQTDTAREFNPNNISSGNTEGSYHPVLAGVGTGHRGRMEAGNMKAPFNTAGNMGTQTMTCSDCHESNNTADPNGPHGSTAGFILKGPNTTWNGTLSVDNGPSRRNMPNGTFCINCHDQGFANSQFVENAGDPSLHWDRNDHYNRNGSIYCWNCHSAIPHGSARPGLLVSPRTQSIGGLQYTDAAPYMRIPASNSGLQLNSYFTSAGSNWNQNDCDCGDKGWGH